MSAKVIEGIQTVLDSINVKNGDYSALEMAANKIRGDRGWDKFVKDMTSDLEEEEGNCARRFLNGLRSRAKMNSREGGY